MTKASNEEELEREVRPCSIPRAMALEIMRDQELKDLEYELELWEADAIRGREGARENVRAIKDRINELKLSQPPIA